MLYPSDEERIKTFIFPLKVKWHTGWQNFARNRRLPKALVLDIPNRDALQKVIKQINIINEKRSPKTKITYRASGGGEKALASKDYNESFSFSPCVDADIIIRLTGVEFEKIDLVNAEKNLVKVGAGIQIGLLDKYLYENLKLVLPTSSLFSYPTSVGLAANAGHGTGLWEEGFAGLVRELTICRPDGEIVTVNVDTRDFHTIRSANLGLFGIVLNQTLQCVPAKKLHCEMDATNIEKLLPKISSGLFHYNDYASVMYVPTGRTDKSERNKTNNVLIVKMNGVPLDTPNKNHCPALDYIGQDLSVKLQEAFDIPNILAHYPKLIPDYMRYIVSGISVGKDREAIGPWYDIMHYQKSFPWKIDDADYLFQMSADGHELNQAMNFVVNKLTQYAAKGLYPVTYAIYVRVFGGTNGGLSTSEHESGKAICGFDIVSDPAVPGYQDFKREVQEYFFKELKARPHWGKTVPLDVDYEAMYGDRWQEFKQALERWYQASDTTLAMSPLLTSFYAQILKVTEAVHTAVPPSLKSTPRLFDSGKSKEERIKELAAKFIDDGGYGTQLRRGFMK